MKIGILQSGRSPEKLVSEYGEYGDMFQTMLAGRGFDFHVYDVLESDFPATLKEQDGWIITGSRFGAYESHDWIPPLEDLIREIHNARMPMIGVCFGHQIIAQALGGKVEKFEGGWAVGRYEYPMESGQTLPLFAWHQDQVTTPPPEAKTVSSTDFCAHAAFTIGNHIYTIQPHPEFDAGFIKGLAEFRAKGIVPEKQRLEAIESTKAPVAKEAMADQFEAVLKGVNFYG